MRSLLTPLVWLALAATALGAVTIDAPPGPVPVDRFVVLPIAGAEVKPQVHVWPKTATALVDISVGQPHVVFRADEPGTYEVTVIASRARVIPAAAYDRCLILVGDEPDPDPDPDPDPKPDPDPDPQPTPVDYLTVLVVEESKEQTWQRPWGHIVGSLAVEEWLKKHGHQRLQVRDKDALDDEGEVPEDLAPWIKLARDQWTVGWPQVFCLDGGKLLHHGPLPTSESMLLELLRQYGREKSGQPDAVDCPTCPPKTQPVGPRPQPPARRGLLRRR